LLLIEIIWIHTCKLVFIKLTLGFDDLRTELK